MAVTAGTERRAGTSSTASSPRGGRPPRPHPGLGTTHGRGRRRPRRRRRVALAGRPAAARSGSATARAPRSGTSTAPSTSTCTPASARCSSATPTRRSSRPSAERVALGTHFAQPIADSIPVAGELARRFGLPLWRFANSGTEATMAAIHLMRAVDRPPAASSRSRARYHGHHDRVQVSVYPTPRTPGRPTARARSPSHGGVPAEVAALDHRRAVRRPRRRARVLLAAHPGEIAGMIIEPVMMNIGIIPPPPGYLAGLADLLHAHGALLTFDEVKTGLDHRAGRRHRALRRRARHRLPGQGARRRAAVRRDRRHRRR